MKLTAVLSIMLVGIAFTKCTSLRRHRREATASAEPNPGGALWAAAAAVGCESCGRECASACGTRHFRACCFNYLRRKRAPLTSAPAQPPAALKLWLAKNQDLEYRHDKRMPIFIESLADASTGAAVPAQTLGYNDIDELAEDPLESRLQLIYDA